MKLPRRIKLDIDQECYNLIPAQQGDTARVLNFQILNNGIPFSLENKTVRARIKKPDSNVCYNDMEIINASEGECDLKLTNQILIKPGMCKVQLEIMENGEILSTIIFAIFIRESINIKDAAESTNEFTALENGIIKLDEWDKYFKETSGQIEQKYTTELNNVKSSLEDITKKQASLDYVCPEWFKSFNIIDSAYAIIEAINYASANKKKVKLTGEYVIAQNIDCPSDTYIFGFGKNKTKITARNNGGFSFIGKKENTKKNFLLKDLSLLKFNMDKIGYGVSVAYATNFDFKNCAIEGFDLGVAISYSWVGSFIGNWIANNNTGVKLDKKLFALSETDDQNAIVFDGNNQFLSNVVGLEINGGINNKILNNCFEGNKSQALIIRSVYDLYIEKTLEI